MMRAQLSIAALAAATLAGCSSRSASRATEELSIADVARKVAAQAGRAIEIVPGKLQAGGTPRRCPDISKLQRLGYKPRVSLDEGLKATVDWYWRNAALAPKK